MNWSELHFLRPEYFWGFVPLLLGVILFARQQLARHSWQQSVDPELLPFLLEGRSGSKRWWTPIWLALLGSFLLLALTGPSIHKVKIPVIKQQHAAVIVMDLSISMYAQDIKPSRLRQTHFFVADLLKARKEGQTGLIAFTADAFVVAPLTDDSNTLLNLLPTLEPTTMPMGGSNPLAGIRAAEALMSNAKAGVGHIILISDGIVESQFNNLTSAIKQSPHKITVLGVGTDEGAPIPAVQGGFYKEENGSMIVASLGEALLKKLCRESGCSYQPLRAGGDVKSLAKTEVMASDEESASVQREFDSWQDGGAWLVLCALPFCLLAFRRGWLISLPLLLVLQPEPAMAADWQSKLQSQWQNLWQTQNQQAARKLETAPAEAATQFEDPRWRAAAHYRADDFEAAAESWSTFDDADAHYNRGNALAKSGALEDAITAYDRALELQPDMEDALRNKAIIEQLLKQQEQQEKEQDQNQEQQDQNQDQQDKQDGEQQQGDGGEQSQQDKEKKQGDQDSQQSQSADKSGDRSNDQQPGDEEQGENQQQSSAGDEQREQQEAEAKAEQEQAAREAEAQAAEQQAAQQGEMRESDEKPEDAEQVAVAAEEAMDSEEQQELKQWLRKIPDDPSGLLRRKFESQSAERRARKQLPELENVAPY